MTSESEVRALTSAQEQFLALFHSLPSDNSRRSFGLWLRDAALPDLLSAPAGPGTDYDGVLVGRELLNRISGRAEVVHILRSTLKHQQMIASFRVGQMTLYAELLKLER